MTQRTYRRAGGPGRRTRPIRRASAGLTPVRAGAALAMLLSALAPSTASPRRRRSGSRRLEIEGAIDHLGRGDPGPARPGRGREPVRDRDRAARGAPPRDPGGRRRRDLARPARHRRRPDRGARADPRLAGRGPAPPRRRGRAALRASSTRRRPQSIAELPVIVDDRAASRQARRRPADRPGRPRRGDPPRVAHARPRSAAAHPGCRSASPTRTASSSAPCPRAGSRSSASTAEPADDRAHPGPGPGCSSELLLGRRGDGRARHPRRRPRRDVHPEAVAEPVGRRPSRDGGRPAGLPLVARVE